MKYKKLLATGLCAVMVLAGCGSSKTASTSSTTSTTSTAEASSEAAAATSEASYDSAPTTSENLNEVKDMSTLVTLGTYKGLTLVAPEGTVTANGMTVNLDYKGTIDGTAFDGGTAQGQNLKLGSGSFIDGFEDQLVGHKKGDQVTVTVTFPEDYGVDSLNGKEAQFDCTINEIYEQTADEAMQTLISESKVKAYPQDLIDSWTRYFQNQYQQAADQAGQSVEDYMKSIGYTDEMTQANVKNYAKGELVARAVMKAEGITEDSQEYKDAQDKVLAMYGVSSLSDASSMGLDDTGARFMTEYEVLVNVIQENAAS